MKSSLLLFFILFSFSAGAQINRTLFNDNWEFYLRPTDPATIVNLPHTPKLEPLVMTEQFLGEVVYKKYFHYQLTPGNKLIIEFEGAMHSARVKLNGKDIGNHVGGYLPFKLDLTSALKDSFNLLEVVLDNREDPTIPPGKNLKELDFYYHAGIYRNVWLTELGGIELQDPYFQTLQLTGQTATVRLDVNVKFDPEFSRLPIEVKAKLGPNALNLKPSSNNIDSTNRLNYFVESKLLYPEPWSLEQPHLVKLEILVLLKGDTIALQQLNVGIRKAELKTDGFYLNGKKIFLSGTNRHQEYPYVGYAVPDNAQWRDAYLIKEAGFNFVRLSHYPQAPAFYAACDELGIIVMDAITGWQFLGPVPFEARTKSDLETLILRDRNHPSVIFWENSLNETQMPDALIEDFNRIAKPLIKGQGFTAGWQDHPSYDLFIPARQHAKAPEYWNNYKTTSRPVFIAEYGDWEYYAQNAGMNQTQFADLKTADRNSRHLRGASEKALLQQAYNFQEASNSNRRGPNTIGEANWVCFDYNRGYSPDLEASGVYDITRLPKLSVNYYQSQQKLSPKTANITIASNWTPSSPAQITVFSNCPKVALYLNGELVGLQAKKSDAASDKLLNPPYQFAIPKFIPGKLEAIGYDDKQKALTSHIVRTPEKPQRIILYLDTMGRSIDQNKADLVFIRAKLVDANGNVVPTNEWKVTFSIIAQEAGLMSPAIQQMEAGIASALLRTENPQTPIQIKVSLPLLGLQNELLWNP
ncbi:MAG: hypothetical protein RLZZ65_1129 [Bacteroidota bacterium]|jgi:beta-galactosidase